MHNNFNSYISFGELDVKIPFPFFNSEEVEEKVTEKNTFDLTVKVGSITVGGFSSPDASEINAPKIKTLIARDIFPWSEVYSFYEHANDIDFLNKKFDELREKEIKGKITEFERNLLYNVIEKRILEFPNPYLPIDHDKAMEISNRYLLLEKKFDKKYKNKKINKLFSIISSWLG